MDGKNQEIAMCSSRFVDDADVRSFVLFLVVAVAVMSPPDDEK